jgi:negative regulator of flagellin synthesis FlgM
LPIHQLQGNTLERGEAMRIDLNPSTMPPLDRSNGSAASARAAQDMTKPLGPDAVDVAHLSTGSDSVQRLKAHLDSVPEVRQQRVNELRQAIGEGTFQVSPAGIAAAMLAETSPAAG